MESVQVAPSVIAHDTLLLNLKRQSSLKSRIDYLQTKLSEIDGLVNQVELLQESELPADDQNEEEELVITTPGSFKPIGMLSKSQLVDDISPFHADAARRQRFLQHTISSLVTEKEQKSLRNQVVTENKRLWVLREQRKGSMNPLNRLSSMSDDDFIDNLNDLDWSRIATAVSEDVGTSRTAWTCRLRWMNGLHSKQGNDEHSASLLNSSSQLVSGLDGEIEPPELWNAYGGGRKVLQAVKAAINKHTLEWSAEEDGRLIDAVQRYGDNNWSIVALATSCRVTAAQCESRHHRLVSSPILSSGPWTSSEVDRLQRAVAQCGMSNYTTLARMVGTRTRQQCRERCLNHHHDKDTFVDRWTEAEELQLVKAVQSVQKENGEIRWASVSTAMRGIRDEDEYRSRYSILTKGDRQLSAEKDNTVVRPTIRRKILPKSTNVKETVKPRQNQYIFRVDYSTQSTSNVPIASSEHKSLSYATPVVSDVSGDSAVTSVDDARLNEYDPRLLLTPVVSAALNQGPGDDGATQPSNTLRRSQRKKHLRYQDAK